MEKAKVLERLIKESGMSVRAFAEKCGLPESTVYTILKKGAGKANVNNVISMCKVLGISVEELDEISKGEAMTIYEPTYEDIQSLIARNGKKLTLEQKQDIIRTLLSDD
ncbi:MAG TPA: XRE family transcriptional regulator [Lachnoclostridium sp.]|uniref:helix-turn-helix domain-containing protein n=1 Tax=Lacrimispora sp. TaxID=2719234 RepID=UPI000E9EF7E4|nr:helix-turn-helix transcriptional regulator [Lacrimispora sp.]HBC99812.1 XRE family transcriptional regulator [Lachnoclostridium sp.]